MSQFPTSGQRPPATDIQPAVSSPLPPLPREDDWLYILRHYVAYWSNFTFFTLGFSLRMEGMVHMPRTGPVLVIANHQSFFDPLLVGLAVRRPLSYVARSNLFRPGPIARLLRCMSAVPINQHGLGIEGLRVTLDLLHQGRALVIFPEGERTPDGGMQPLRAGVQLLIKKAPAPIVPVGIAGAYDAWPRWRRLPIPAPVFMPPCPRTIAVSVGPVLQADRFAGLPRDELLHALFLELQKVHRRAERLRRKPRS